MATDDVSEFDIECLCKKGKIHVTVTSPDHPWVREHQIIRDYEILCRSCAEKYAVVEDGIVEREAKSKADAARQQLAHAEKELEQSGAVADLKQQVIDHLKTLKSVAAIHRFLSACGKGHGTIGTFRKHWSTVDDWANNKALSTIYASNVPRILAALGINGTPFAADLTKIEALKKAIPPVPTIKKLR